MITAGEYRVKTIVAVWREDKAIDPNGKLYVLSPCGYCRQFMPDINGGNLETDVILGRDKVVKLKDLLPYHEWPEQFDRQLSPPTAARALKSAAFRFDLRKCLSPKLGRGQ